MGCDICGRESAGMVYKDGRTLCPNCFNAMQVVVKTCKKCGLSKLLSAFYKNKNSKDGHENICKACRRKQAKQRKIDKLVAETLTTTERQILNSKGRSKGVSVNKHDGIMSQKLIIKECDQIKEMLLQKNAEYGDSALNPLRLFSTAPTNEQIRVRIDDKLSRLRNQREKVIVEDTVADLIGYLILLRVAERMAVG